MHQSFVAIDFETANSSRASACEIGLCRVIDGEIESRYGSLISPPPSVGAFHERNVRIHGITPESVEGAPRWVDLWPEVRDFIGELPLVAHNASFDISVMRNSLSAFRLEWPELDYWCTLVLGRSALNLPSYTLGAVSKAIGLKHENLHRAESDAESAARVLLAFFDLTSTVALESLGTELDVRKGRLFSDYWITCRPYAGSNLSQEEAFLQRLESVGVDVDAPDPSGDFFGKSVAITGTLDCMTRDEALLVLEKAGALPKTTVSKKLDFLISGVQDLQRLVEGEVNSSKYRKVQELRAQGSAIEILDEEQFLQMLSR